VCIAAEGVEYKYGVIPLGAELSENLVFHIHGEEQASAVKRQGIVFVGEANAVRLHIPHGAGGIRWVVLSNGFANQCVKRVTHSGSDSVLKGFLSKVLLPYTDTTVSK
jgi:hypothetical protein